MQNKQDEKLVKFTKGYLYEIRSQENVLAGYLFGVIHKLDINDIEQFLNIKYENKFKGLYFENMPFEEQVKYFNNAKLIICAHGAVMSNMFFCKEGTKIIEVTCNMNWQFFNTISNILNLKHIKCKNNINDIINCLKINEI
jgi:hypothetical protein